MGVGRYRRQADGCLRLSEGFVEYPEDGCTLKHQAYASWSIPKMVSIW